ncbi:unnamed protein product [Closterium sp. Naga37s-1]|nr:unnamed protein product [Closterium sp. Naga37s-1]
MLESFKKTFVRSREKQGKTDAASHNAGNAAAAAAIATWGGPDAGKAECSFPSPGGTNPTASVRRDPNEEIAQASLPPFAELPLLNDVGVQEKQALFIRKLRLCSYLFDFNDPMKNATEKEIKRQTLLELVDYVGRGTGKVNEAVFEDIARMLEINLFRPLPLSAHAISGTEPKGPEEKKPTMEAAWPHLQIVYDFLLSQEAVLFLEELEEVLKETQLPEFQMVMTPLFQQIACCLSSSHFQSPEYQMATTLLFQQIACCLRPSHFEQTPEFLTFMTPLFMQIVRCFGSSHIRWWNSDCFLMLVAQNSYASPSTLPPSPPTQSRSPSAFKLRNSDYFVALVVAHITASCAP